VSYTNAQFSVIASNPLTGSWNFTTTRFALHALTQDAWSETTMSWTNRPKGAATSLGTSEVGNALFVEACPWVDVTSSLAAQSDGLLTLRMQNDRAAPSRSALVSRETAAYSPSLILERSWPRLILSANLARAELGTPLLLRSDSQGGNGFAWSKVSGPGSVVFTADGVGRTLASFAQEGTFTLRATVTLGADTLTEQHVVTVAATGTDSDGDALNDAWEYHHFGNLTAASSAAHDADGDGLSLRLEQSLGTDPFSRDAQALQMQMGTPRSLRFTRSRAAGVPAPQPQWSSDLSAWQAITSAVRLISQTPWTETVEVDIPAADQRSFARLAVP
jgi:hypothetical protein